ncbi:protein kinase domain-containing protein [Aneurinibacillus aneurinilyticus]|uniref:Protein kinase n=1 Tax=Aneurinibacillus aneurinilyticus TaxID=1391 RepID=A0A848CZ69_ANEAE|nr:LuxR C-terminal-related transcriptional regulator [Aneurinibacillus aneurinilyticus]NME98746.1 protein kinase [Aneurinibacillus aneurinilyticus]
MFTVPGYEIHEVILEDQHIVVAYATCTQTACNVIVKMVKEGPRTIIENAKLMHEFEIAGVLDIPEIVKPLSLLRQGNSLVIILQSIKGVTLRHYFRSHRVSSRNFVQLAIRILRVLDKLNQHHVLHMNIRPDTIIIEPNSTHIYVTGFGYAVRTEGERRNIPLLEGSPPYMSPERNARMNGMIDVRSDLYSLGITFYELLSGRMPFHASDPLEWAHAHLAIEPLPLAGKSPPIPESISRIILKLLAKTAEERYQSPGQLIEDLEKCLHQLEAEEIYESGKNALQHNMPRLDSRLRLTKERTSVTKTESSVPVISFGYARMLDLAALMKASKAFSEEKEPEQLMRTLMNIILEDAGAQRGCLVRVIGEALYVEAAVEAGGGVAIFETVPLDEYDGVCHELVRCVAVTKDLVIVNDAYKEGKFVNTSYVVRRRPKSLLGLPIYIQGILTCILYLENNLIRGAFGFDSYEVLHMLASQAVYVKKQQFSSEGIRKLKNGGHIFSPSTHLLTDREIEVIRLMAVGLSNKEIAERLFIATGTVHVHIKHIYAKLKVNRRVQAVTQAAVLGLLEDI